MERTEPATVFDRLGERPQVAAAIDWTLIDLDRDSQKIHLSFTTVDEFTNPAGNVHGGYIAAMLDECMGSAIVGLTDAKFLPATISMTIDFIQPIAVGKVLGEAHIVSMSTNSAHLEAKLTDPDGRIRARAIGTYRLLAFSSASPNGPARP
ncbi:PaaI family thioesterase [Nocardia sp. CA-128927]|uniref:PaaI family thioesterase n=1 Tax=Nocardia sp. CA-128927 TaxID=3239975 RepID=UPI003D98CCB7